MNTGSRKTRKKPSPKAPAKGQQTLWSFLPNRCSSSTQSSPPKDASLLVSKGHIESQAHKETGKKRKLSYSDVGNNSHQPKPKKSSVANSEIKGVHSNQYESRKSSHKPNAHHFLATDNILPLKSDVFTEEMSGVEQSETQLLDSSICDNMHMGSMESENDLTLKENSPEVCSFKVKDGEFDPKIKPKRNSPLQTVSQNVQFDSLQREDDGQTLAKREKGLVDLLSDCERNGRISNGKEIEKGVGKAEVEAAGFGDDDFLFDAFDTSFKTEDEVDKTSKDSGLHSQSNCDTITYDFDTVFSDDWNLDTKDEVDLSSLQRCRVSDINRDKFMNLIVDVIHVDSQTPVTVTLMGFWKEARLQPGDFVNIQATKRSNAWVVDNTNGFVIEQPDFLISGTSVVGALFCARRGVLSDRFKGIESVTDCKQGASVMVIGNLVHELLQEVLQKKIYSKPGIAKLLKDILNSQKTANILYSASMSTENCQKEMSPFVPKIFHFIERYIKGKTSNPKDENFNGKINVVRDIEENLWVPQLGTKGKVDVSVEVNVNLRPRIMPLELKTGRASFSIEHRGQVILYTMMMAATGQDVETGLLLYLRENIMREIRVGHPERRDLMLLRNNLAYYLTRKPETINQTDSGPDLEPEMELPEPINHPACRNCPYSTLCCTYLKNDRNYKLNDRHPLTPIIQELDNYLKPEHIDYVKRWVKMLQIEEADQVDTVKSLRFIWTVPPTQREKKGKCIANLKIIGKVIEESNRYYHTFARVDSNNSKLIDDLTKSGCNIMEWVIVSTNTRINVCAGPLIKLCKDSVTVSLERNLVEKKPNEVFHIDGYISQSVLTLNLSNIGYLLDDNTVTERMRKIVIERAPATFLKKLDRSVQAAAIRILKPLNKMQQRAVLKVLTANEYLLIKGMPGSGKTITLVAMIELLVKLGKSVLVSAHTHSAVDNVLQKLIKTDVDFVRLGSTNKIHPSLLSKSESVLTQDCYSPESLDAAYSSKNVVCVTCLGANHSLLGRRMFDVCLVDESTQVLQSSVLRPLYSASKFVLIGDPDQLPPVVKSNVARELGMDQSLFERLDTENNTVTLTSQYRMNQRIMSVANQVTYKGQLTVGTDEIGSATLDIPDKSVLDSSQEWVRATLSTDLDDSVIVLDTGDKYNVLKNDTGSENDVYYAERKCSNLCEAAVILHLIATLVQAGVVADKIGVIAPYRDQVNLLRTIIKQNVEVNTVDQYQGRDKEIILYSGTRSAFSRSDVARDEFNILDDHRRLTVAITRAKHKLIVVGDVKTLKQFVPFMKLFRHIRSKDLIVLKNGSADFIWDELLNIVKD